MKNGQAIGTASCYATNTTRTSMAGPSYGQGICWPVQPTLPHAPRMTQRPGIAREVRGKSDYLLLSRERFLKFSRFELSPSMLRHGDDSERLRRAIKGMCLTFARILFGYHTPYFL